jgi:hypothetical protein
MTTLQRRIDGSDLNGMGYLVDGDEGDIVVNRDCRIYGEGSPWWGPARLLGLEVRHVRVLLERLTIQDLWLRGAYMSTIRDCLIVDGPLYVKGGPSDPISESPGNILFDGVHVRHGYVNIRSSNITWIGGTIERTTSDILIGQSGDQEGTIFVGTRFEHDTRRKIVVGGSAPVVFDSCHFALTDIEFLPGSHPACEVKGNCTLVQSQVIDRRRVDPEPKPPAKKRFIFF